MYQLIFLIIYIYISLALMSVARKGKAGRLWFAWIPIAREYMLATLAEKSWRWVILFFIPVVNVVASWIVWSAVAHKIGRSRWWGRLMVVPFLNLFILAVLAFNLNPKSWPSRLKKYYQTRWVKKETANLFKDPKQENREIQSLK